MPAIEMKLPFHFDIAPRDALAAPTKTDQTRVQSLVILFVSIVSALGAAWIMLSFVVRVAEYLGNKLEDHTNPW